MDARRRRVVVAWRMRRARLDARRTVAHRLCHRLRRGRPDDRGCAPCSARGPGDATRWRRWRRLAAATALFRRGQWTKLRVSRGVSADGTLEVAMARLLQQMAVAQAVPARWMRSDPTSRRCAGAGDARGRDAVIFTAWCRPRRTAADNRRVRCADHGVAAHWPRAGAGALGGGTGAGVGEHAAAACGAERTQSSGGAAPSLPAGAAPPAAHPAPSASRRREQGV